MSTYIGISMRTLPICVFDVKYVTFLLRFCVDYSVSTASHRSKATKWCKFPPFFT